MCKKIFALTLALILAAASPATTFAMPYRGYTYNFWATLVPAPAAYVPVRSFSFADICESLGDMNDPTEIRVDGEGNIYVSDRGNDRIVVFDAELNLVRVIDGYYRGGRWVEDGLNRPHGVFVTGDGLLYIADNQNNRVVILELVGEDMHFVREILAPQVEGLEDTFVFLPQHVLVDRGGRVFVIVQHVFEGIMSFNAAGEFLGYYGTIEVSFNPLQLIWRFIQTEEQRARQTRFIPREFQSMDMDGYGFVFTTHVENSPTDNQVMRLNPRGEDVLVNFNENVVISGDQGWRVAGHLSGPSVFVDIIARSHGMYSTLCNVRGRVYTYDSEGNLLYVFGGIGNMRGMSRRPVSIDMLGEDILLLDADGRGRIIHYAPTEYGGLINSAIRLRYDGFERYAVEYWRELVRLDENFSLAWAGIGRAYMALGENATAMYYLRRGMDVRNYSLAFRRNRLDVMQDRLPIMLNGGVLLIGAFVAYRIVRKVRNAKSHAKEGGGE